MAASVKNGKTCKLTFTDKHNRTGYQSSPANGHKVCFATKAPNKVTNTKPKCVLTNSKGVATSVFTAKAKVNCNFRPNFEGQNPFGGVWDIQTTSKYLWVAGGFETVGGIAHRGIARFTF